MQQLRASLWLARRLGSYCLAPKERQRSGARITGADEGNRMRRRAGEIAAVQPRNPGPGSSERLWASASEQENLYYI